MAEGIDDQKQAIRERVRAARAGLDDDEARERAESLLEQLRMLIIGRGVNAISCYYPVIGEPNTLPFLDWAHAEGVRVLLPISRVDGLLDWVEYTPGDISPGLYGIPEPGGEHLSPIAVGEVDLMLIPASAVDTSGNRLGWGRGYFDKSLGSMDQRPPVFAVVYDEEIFASVPTDVHDVPVTGIVTPSRILHFE